MPASGAPPGPLTCPEIVNAASAVPAGPTTPSTTAAARPLTRFQNITVPPLPSGAAAGPAARRPAPRPRPAGHGARAGPGPRHSARSVIHAPGYAQGEQD